MAIILLLLLSSAAVASAQSGLCAKDPSYAKSIAAAGDGHNKNWKEYMVPPTDPNSAYAVCYNNAMANKNYTMVGTRTPLMPWCVDLPTADQVSNLAARYESRLVGFECGCVPPRKTRSMNWPIHGYYSTFCEPAPCDYCLVDEGYTCDNAKDLECDCRAPKIEILVKGVATCRDRNNIADADLVTRSPSTNGRH